MVRCVILFAFASKRSNTSGFNKFPSTSTMDLYSSSFSVARAVCPLVLNCFIFFAASSFSLFSRSSGVSFRYPSCNFMTSAKIFRSFFMSLICSPPKLIAASANCMVFRFVSSCFFPFPLPGFFSWDVALLSLLFFLLSLLLSLLFFFPSAPRFFFF